MNRLQDENRPSDTSEPLVSLQALGTDVRDALSDLFSQAKQDFVLSPQVKGQIYLTIHNQPFTIALNAVCEAAELKYARRGTVYYVQPLTGGAAGARAELSEKVLLVKLVSLNLRGSDLKTALASLQKQTGAPMRLAPNAPNLRLNATLQKVSLQTALNAICTGTGLEYRWTGSGFEIKRSESVPVVSPSRVVTLQPPIGVESQLSAKPSPIRSIPPSTGGIPCPKCRYALQKGWKYCPMCGAWVKPITE